NYHTLVRRIDLSRRGEWSALSPNLGIHTIQLLTLFSTPAFPDSSRNIFEGAREQAGLALSRQLAAESVALLPTGLDAYIPTALLAVESMKRRPLLENHAALRQSIALMARQVSRLAHQGPVYAVAFSP